MSATPGAPTPIRPDQPATTVDADPAVPVSLPWPEQPRPKPFDEATDHAQLLASLRVTRATIVRNAIGHHMSEALYEDTVESLTVPAGRDAATPRPALVDPAESVRYMTRPVASQAAEVRLPTQRPPTSAAAGHPDVTEPPSVPAAEPTPSADLLTPEDWQPVGPLPTLDPRPPVDQRPTLQPRPPVDERPTLQPRPPVDERPTLEPRPPVDQRPTLEPRPPLVQRPTLDQRVVRSRPQLDTPAAEERTPVEVRPAADQHSPMAPRQPMGRRMPGVPVAATTETRQSPIAGSEPVPKIEADDDGGAHDEAVLIEAAAGIDPLTGPRSSLPGTGGVLVQDNVPQLPVRVPAPHDVPDVPDDEDDEFDDAIEAIEPENVDGPELKRIATGLRDNEMPSAPPADLDVAAVLEAVRGVPGVANAQLRGNPGGMHTLRLDLADGADAGRVSRQVARLLKERMGLAAEPRRSRTGSREPLVEEAPKPPEQVPAVPSPPVVTADPSLFPRPRPSTLSDVAGIDGRLPDPPARIVVDQVRVSTLGSEATVEVRLGTGGAPSVGAATGPAVDGYLLRLAAQAAANAIDGLVEASPAAPQVRCFIDHAGVVPFGSCVVAVVVVLVSGAGWVEQLVGSAIVAGDPRQAIVRATLAAMNRRLESLLA